MPGRRLLLLAEQSFGTMSSKTANAAIRYIPEQVVAVVDSARAGQIAQQVLGFGGDIPVVGTVEEGIRLSPTEAVVGVAPSGGRLPETWREMIRKSIAAKLNVWSGLHSFLSDDQEFAALARAAGVSLVDVRKPPTDLPVSAGRARDTAATIILAVGTDCNVGKMTAQLQIRNAMKRSGVRVGFAATGQTGMLVEGRGIAVDAVVADFIGGAAERVTLETAEHSDIVLVEGQGSLVHPGYSGVTLGLTHGSMPHAFLLCGQPSRKTVKDNDWLPIPPLTELIRLYEHTMAPVREAPVIGIALNTHDISEDEALGAIAEAESETGLPCTDPVRFDPAPLADALLGFHARRTGAAV